MGSGLLEEFHPLRGIVCLVQYTTWEHMGVSLREKGKECSREEGKE